jgi:hypothetical protein
VGKAVFRLAQYKSMAYNKNIKPQEFTGCGNHQCPIRTGCLRYETKRHFTNIFNPARVRGVVSCAMRIGSK